MALDRTEIVRSTQVRAERDLGRDRDAVLRSFGLSAEAWSTLELSAIELLADDVDGGRVANGERFAAAHGEPRGPDPAANMAIAASAPAQLHQLRPSGRSRRTRRFLAGSTSTAPVRSTRARSANSPFKERCRSIPERRPRTSLPFARPPSPERRDHDGGR